ncbi:hypothetical protein [Paenibacillus sp. NEAU-GSW1]|uniref:hypothetical protein n=1 Tax=Paenibacillus sp. NEAU-GSW1 TaxID=2682486 RepID=UPI0012E242D4|nr:hypothetical protein [Paenibacillus sp. NEAU-GSW1]MUT64408.1 hypothetical protein [Paenibacillus sp. NEAU-GSW1]
MLFLLFFLLSACCFIAFILGLIKPSIVIKWGKNRTRGKVSLYYGLGMIISFIIFVAVLPPVETDNISASSAINKEEAKKSDNTVKANNTDKQDEEKAAAEAKKKAEKEEKARAVKEEKAKKEAEKKAAEEAKAKAEAEKKAKKEAEEKAEAIRKANSKKASLIREISQGITGELIGNEAYDFIVDNPSLFPAATDKDIESAMSKVDSSITTRHLFKNITPYYTKMVQFTGTVISIEESVYDEQPYTYIHIFTDDMDSITAIYMGTTGDLLDDDVATITGIPTITYSFENVSGGSTNAILLSAAYVEKL